MHRGSIQRARHLHLWDDGDHDDLSAACAGSGCSICRADLDGEDAGRAPPAAGRGPRATALEPMPGRGAR